MLSFKSLQTFFCIKQRPGSFSDLNQVLPESEHNHKHFHTAGVSTSRDFTATSDILVEKKTRYIVSEHFTHTFSINIFAT